MSDTPARPSAAELARQLGSLPRPEDFPRAQFELVDAVRNFIAAVVTTRAKDEILRATTQHVRAWTEALDAERRDTPIALVRDAQGRLENLTQAGSGRLNPQAPRLEFESWPAPPPPGAAPRSVEIRATTTLSPAHGGPPYRAHGGIVALLLDVILGEAVVSAGAPGMTAGLNVRYRKATPYGTPLTLAARYVRHEGRKVFAKGEILADGEVTAEAEGIFISAKN